MMDFKLNGLFAEVMEPNPGTRDATEQLKKVFTTAFGMEWKDDHDYSLIPFSCYFTMDNDKFMAITYWTAFSFLMDDQLRAEKDITVIRYV
ncbi:unnamed protein product [Medioppia subpectinata]|uniref:Uncharacterized protein n=1 Tax=Medioppia subpectinata TaxID=1979941 RepID=A0A7R9KI22_9ACAR|nr:unnamed protein product [Medioppia subpectinata]CAG2103691.1 unnamed protein product [Medioppia subpectinata]